jgi:hypothetical protein
MLLKLAFLGRVQSFLAGWSCDCARMLVFSSSSQNDEYFTPGSTMFAFDFWYGSRNKACPICRLSTVSGEPHPYGGTLEYYRKELKILQYDVPLVILQIRL